MVIEITFFPTPPGLLNGPAPYIGISRRSSLQRCCIDRKSICPPLWSDVWYGALVRGERRSDFSRLDRKFGFLPLRHRVLHPPSSIFCTASPQRHCAGRSAPCIIAVHGAILTRFLRGMICLGMGCSRRAAGIDVRPGLAAAMRWGMAGARG